MADDTGVLQDLSLDHIGLDDIESVRLILRGGSVVDWHRLNLQTPDSVRRFLNINGYDPDATADNDRLRELIGRAVAYLEDNFNYHFPAHLKAPRSAIELILVASGTGEYQNLACILLKVMHIINHLDGQELRHRLPQAEDHFYRCAEATVERTVRNLIADGAPIVDYATSRKTRDSLITKLLAKRHTIASQVFDRLRFRIVTRTATDLLPVMVYLKDHLFPYNYVIPGQSRNEILRSEDVLKAVPAMQSLVHQMQFPFHLEDPDAEDPNRFSADSFRMINFVTDIPLRVGDMVAEAADPSLASLGFLVFVLCEFQMFDEKTFLENEQGESNHEHYKDRQKWQVIRRLVYGDAGESYRGPGRSRG
jgi:uncharacterized protein (TIGR04552 family)